jgi:hypothetical protein
VAEEPKYSVIKKGQLPDFIPLAVEPEVSATSALDSLLYRQACYFIDILDYTSHQTNSTGFAYPFEWNQRLTRRQQLEVLTRDYLERQAPEKLPRKPSSSSTKAQKGRSVKCEQRKKKFSPESKIHSEITILDRKEVSRNPTKNTAMLLK